MQFNEEIILNDIKEMLSQEYSTVEITMDTYLEFGEGSYLDMSSIEIVEFIVILEEKYDIIIDFEDRYYTIGDVVRGVVSYLKKKANPEMEKKSESEV